MLNKTPSTLNDFELKKLAPNPSSQSSGYRYPIEHSTVFQSLSSAEFNEAKICDKTPNFGGQNPNGFIQEKTHKDLYPNLKFHFQFECYQHNPKNLINKNDCV